MKKFITLFLFSLLIMGVNAQETDKKEKPEKEKKEKTSKDKSDKGKNTDADVFIGEPEGEKFQNTEREEVSKPLMPLYDVEQGFNQKGKKKKQEDAFLADEYYFPAKPKNAWQVGVTGGIAMINGDINQNFFKGDKPALPGYTFGAYVKKPFSYMFSMRMKYSYLEFWNTDWQPSTLTNDQIRNTRATGDDWAYSNYTMPGDTVAHPSRVNYFQNSHTVAHDLTLDAIISFGNVRFHKERTKVVFNVFLTGGGMLFRTWTDAYDADGNPYDYASIVGNPDYTDASKKDVIKQLNAMRDGVYETQAEAPTNGEAAQLMGYSFIPVFGLGTGFTFRLNRIMDLDLSARMMFTRTDYLDGVRWQEPEGNTKGTFPGSLDSRGITNNFDTYLATEVGFNFKLVGKKKTEPTTLLNPMHYTYQKIAENDPEDAINELLKDDDNDGVPNRLDQEENTPEGAPVNPKGIALDSDSDGIIDLNDEEPFSPPGLPVNEKGVAQLPPPVDDGSGTVICDNVVFPSVHFEKDRYNIQPEFYAHLHNVADKMISCPDMKILATGMTDKDDNEKYNEQLSWNRVNAVIDYLTTNYGIDRSRFIVKYDGENAAKGTSAAEQYRERKVSMEQAADDATGDSNPAAPHPGIKAGTDK